MWSEPTKNGKTRYKERYTDPLTGEVKRVGVTLSGPDSRTNRRLAEEELRKRIERATLSSPIVDITLADLMDKYMDDQARTVKRSTCVRNRSSISVCVKALGPQARVNTLTAGYVREKLLAVANKPVTYNEHLKRFKAMLRWAYDNDFLRSLTIYEKLKPLKDDNADAPINPEEKYLERQQLIDLLKYMQKSQPVWFLLTKFLVLSGLRIGEALALEREDISDGYIRVTKTYSLSTGEITTPKTPHSIREVFVQPELADVISDIKRYMRNNDLLTGFRSPYLFHSVKTEHISYGAYNKYFRETTKKILGEVRTPHCLRHTHASILFGEGVSLDTISRRLGHENSKITQSIYLHIVEKVRERDNEAIRTAVIL